MVAFRDMDDETKLLLIRKAFLTTFWILVFSISLQHNLEILFCSLTRSPVDVKGIWGHLRSFIIILISLGIDPFRKPLFFSLKSHNSMWCKCQHLSQSCYLTTEAEIMLAAVWIQMQICLTCERPLIVPTVVLCIQIRHWKWLRHYETQTNPTHHCKMSLFIWAQGLPALDGKRKAILHVPGDMANCSQWEVTYQEPQLCS